MVNVGLQQAYVTGTFEPLASTNKSRADEGTIGIL